MSITLEPAPGNLSSMTLDLAYGTLWHSPDISLDRYQPMLGSLGLDIRVLPSPILPGDRSAGPRIEPGMNPQASTKPHVRTASRQMHHAGAMARLRAPCRPSLFLITTSWLNSLAGAEREYAEACFRQLNTAIIVRGDPGASPPSLIHDPDVVSLWMDHPLSAPSLQSALRSLLRCILARIELSDAQFEIAVRTLQLEETARVGVALSAVHDIEELHSLILQTSREITGADAGTLYLIEQRSLPADTVPQGADGSPAGPSEANESVLVFSAAQCDSLETSYQKQVLPMNRRSIAGFVALTGQTLRLDDVYLISETADFTFDRRFDQRFGYRTRSMLVVPMRNRRGEMVGVIQLINRKRYFSTRLADLQTIEEEVLPFTEEQEQIIASFGSQAAVALENKLLVESIQKLFEGFVHASITAIESRDPVTSGHSNRVARLTVGLAGAINQVSTGRWKELYFTREQVREIEYAGLLHDFGKVGVREDVLIKAKKLYDWKLERVRNRIQVARSSARAHYAQWKLELALRHPRDEYEALARQLDRTLDSELARLDAAWERIAAANEPIPLDAATLDALARLAESTVMGVDGEPIPLLNPDELHGLSIRQGTLDDEERKEIESHVTHSFNFLIRIPWTPELKGVPGIAHAHHEKLNGTGYPRNLRGDEIPIQAKMMTIADIFDALTAQDRPYKPAIPISRALEILGKEARDGCIDGDLLDLFTEKRVYEVILPDLDRKASIQNA